MTKPKNKGGRPVKYATVAEMQEAIDEYFDYCDNRVQQVYSAKSDGVIEVLNPEPYTMSGLARRLGLSRQGLVEYRAKDKFSDTIKKARDRVEEDVERRMNDKQTFTPGLIFNAKNNFSWKDKTEQEVNHSGDVSFVNKVPRPNRD